MFLASGRDYAVRLEPFGRLCRSNPLGRHGYGRLAGAFATYFSACVTKRAFRRLIWIIAAWGSAAPNMDPRGPTVKFTLAVTSNCKLALPILLVASGMAASATYAGSLPAEPQGWQLERDVDPPSYAVTEPVESNLNIDTVVLACGEIDSHRFLQLEIYPTVPGPLLPLGANPEKPKEDQRAQIDIDGRIFPAGMYFSEDFVTVANVVVDHVPVLSDALLRAMEEGRTMVMRFDLMARPAGRPASFDGHAAIDLRAGQGGTAVAAVRRCASPGGHQVSSDEPLTSIRPGTI